MEGVLPLPFWHNWAQPEDSTPLLRALPPAGADQVPRQRPQVPLQRPQVPRQRLQVPLQRPQAPQQHPQVPLQRPQVPEFRLFEQRPQVPPELNLTLSPMGILGKLRKHSATASSCVCIKAVQSRFLCGNNGRGSPSLAGHAHNSRVNPTAGGPRHSLTPDH